MKRLLLGVALAAGVGSLLAASIFAADFPAKPDTGKAVPPKPPYTISKETTRLTAPLKADGSVDYIEALNEELSNGVTVDNNAAVLLWKAFGPKLISEKARDRYFAKLGIAPLPEKGNYLVSLGEYVKQTTVAPPPGDDQEESVANRLYKQLDETLKRPWSKQEFPAIAGWLAANEKPLALAVEATQRPRRYDPLVGDCDDSDMLIATLLPGVQQHREVARMFVARAMLRAQGGDVNAAWDDLLACHRLSRLSVQGATLIDSLVGIAIDSIACAGDRALLQHVSLTAKEAAAMRAALTRLSPLRGMDAKIDHAERYMFLDCTAAVSQHGLGEITKLVGGPGLGSAVQSFLKVLGAAAINWDDVLRKGNLWYDRLVAAARQPTVAERNAAFAKFDEELKQLNAAANNKAIFALEMLADPQAAASRRIGDVLIALLLPALTTAMQAEDRGVMQDQLVELGFALAAYRADNKSYPEALEDLAPAYVPAIPHDLFGDGKLRYRREAGGYVLYSVGPNGVDDGAHSRDEATDGENWDDILVRVTAKSQR